jgi:hypothetical protein
MSYPTKGHILSNCVVDGKIRLCPWSMNLDVPEKDRDVSMAYITQYL